MGSACTELSAIYLSQIHYNAKHLLSLTGSIIAVLHDFATVCCGPLTVDQATSFRRPVKTEPIAKRKRRKDLDVLL